MDACRIGDHAHGVARLLVKDIDLGAMRDVELVIGTDGDIIPAAGASYFKCLCQMEALAVLRIDGLESKAEDG